MQVLIIDSNNLAALGEFQRKEWGFKDYTYKASFADHLKYINALTEGPQERYAVFDNIKVELLFKQYPSKYPFKEVQIPILAQLPPLAACHQKQARCDCQALALLMRKVVAAAL